MRFFRIIAARRANNRANAAYADYLRRTGSQFSLTSAAREYRQAIISTERALCRAINN